MKLKMKTKIYISIHQSAYINRLFLVSASIILGEDFPEDNQNKNDKIVKHVNDLLIDLRNNVEK